MEGVIGKPGLRHLPAEALEGLGVIVVLLVEDQGHEVVSARATEVARFVDENGELARRMPL